MAFSFLQNVPLVFPRLSVIVKTISIPAFKNEVYLCLRTKIKLYCLFQGSLSFLVPCSLIDHLYLLPEEQLMNEVESTGLDGKRKAEGDLFH